MSSAVEIFLIFVAITESVLGLLGNGFIVLVNCIDYVRKKKFSLICFILTGLAISRICVIWLITLDGYVKVFYPHMYIVGNFSEYISYLWAIFNHLNISFSTSLAIFYFLKIANFSHSIFLGLKRRIKCVFILLMGCMLLSFIFNFLQVAKIINDHKAKYRNTSWQLHTRNREFFLGQLFTNLGIIFFFIVFVITCFLLIFSLWRHHKQMRLHVTGSRDFNTEAHVKAVKALISFIILHVLYFIGIVIETSCATVPENKPLFLFGWINIAVFPCVHAFILIRGNSQLKQTSLRVVQRLKCCEKRQNLSYIDRLAAKWIF
ncbi:PREDICTED: taste receptor type 2 member 10-like [Chinchilla lanigera]|uniref:taste receptor type 2 member 10-like n=1 Tax=Chinchilla lanigera TaxID=34839 RepID=UPI00038F1476|nr:PREDICTED: taste receptor type 2 member 10-like [Chinchilla lanigera]